MSDLADLLRPTRECRCAAHRRVDRALTQHYDTALAASGLGIAQFTILSTLGQAGPLPVSKLAGFLGLDRTTLTRNLGVLAKRGVVELRGGADARLRIVVLTPQGEGAVRAAFPLWQAAQASADTVLREPER